MEAHERAALACERQYALDGSEERLAVDGGAVCVDSRNYGVIVGVTSLDKAAVELATGEFHLSAVVALAYHGVVVGLGEHLLGKSGWFLGKVE